MARFSTGLRNALMSNYGVGLMMNGGIIHVYSGTRPTSPDKAITTGSVLLGKITTGGKVFIAPEDPNGAGLNLIIESPGILLADTSVDDWRLIGEASGRANWYRWMWRYPDPLTESDYYPRVDGLVNTELYLKTLDITSSTDIKVELFLFSLSLGT